MLTCQPVSTTKELDTLDVLWNAAPALILASHKISISKNQSVKL